MFDESRYAVEFKRDYSKHKHWKVERGEDTRHNTRHNTRHKNWCQQGCQQLSRVLFAKTCIFLNLSLESCNWVLSWVLSPVIKQLQFASKKPVQKDPEEDPIDDPVPLHMGPTPSTWAPHIWIRCCRLLEKWEGWLSPTSDLRIPLAPFVDKLS